jgi:hypothetical protein
MAILKIERLAGRFAVVRDWLRHTFTRYSAANDDKPMPRGRYVGRSRVRDASYEAPPSVAAYAKIYRTRGWDPIPLRPKDKAPLFDKDWLTRTYDVDTDFNGDRNIGIRLGVNSYGLVDVDLDCPEAVSLAPAFLPETGSKFGRKSRLRGHWLFNSDPPPETKQYLDPIRAAPGKDGAEKEKAMIVELRSTNVQTMFPPSIHPDGERVEWAKDETPARIAAEDLHQAVKLIAAAVLLGRYWAGPGARDAAAGPLIGTLLRAGWEVDKVRHFVGAVAELGGDPSWRDRLHGIKKMQERLGNKSGRVAGLPTLKRLFDPRIIASMVEWLDLKPAKPGGAHAARLLAIIGETELFHTADGDCYADIEINGHRETWLVRHKKFRQYLTLEFYRATNGAPTANALATALDYAEAVATHDAPMEEVFLRCTRHDGKIYLDLVDEQWRAIEIDADGWRIVPRPPVRFRRANGMRQLTVPVAGGKVDELKPFLNVDDNDFKLVVGWILGSLRGSGPYPILCLYGPPGAAKPTLAEVCRELVDPNKIAARTPPRDERDVFVAAHNALVVIFGNISCLLAWLSDALCRLSSGEGFGTRMLYTDDEEVLFDGMRSIILNGIETFVKREDLANRSISLLLSDIPEDKRRTEAEFWSAFEAAQPRILGALLDAMSHGLRVLPSTKPARLPRMADFAQWIAACEGALWEPGTFAELYCVNRASGEIEVLNADPLGVAVQEFMAWV